MNSEKVSRVIVPVLFLIVVLLTILPVSVPAAASDANGPSLSAMVSSTEPAAGEPVTVSGFAEGGNLTAGVRVWIFGGNYINVTTVPVGENGAFSTTYQTKNLPAGNYHILAEGAGNDGAFDLDLTKTGEYSFDVINPKTGTKVMTFTGVGSVLDMETLEMLSAALNQAGYDDPYAQLSFDLAGQNGGTATVMTTNSVSTPSVSQTVAPTTPGKSPVSAVIPCAALVFAGAALVLYRRH
jgi:hypothetical protein